jgi:ribose 5-phosphate isomerase
MPGIVEHGLFIGMASVVLIASGSHVKELRSDDKHGRLS